MKKYTKWIVGAFCAVALATSAFAADAVKAAPSATVTTEASADWVISLGGVGSTLTAGNDTTTFGVDLSVGRTGELLLPVEYGVRQSISYGDSDTFLNTRVYGDWTLFTLKPLKLDVFVGGNVGLQYGNIKPSWEIAPEAGMRWWLKKDVAVLGRVEVPWDLDGWVFKDSVRYFLGFQVKL